MPPAIPPPHDAPIPDRGRPDPTSPGEERPPSPPGAEPNAAEAGGAGQAGRGESAAADVAPADCAPVHAAPGDAARRHTAPPEAAPPEAAPLDAAAARTAAEPGAAVALPPLPEPFAIARWSVGREYLLAVYGDWLAHLSRWVRHWPKIAALLALLSLAAGLRLGWPRVALVLSLLATIEVLCGLTHRGLWLRRALRGKRLGRPIELRFREPGFELHSGDEGCCLAYGLVREYTLTPSALRLDLGGGMRFVVLDQDLSPPQAKRQIAARLAAQAGPATPRSIPVEAC